MAKLEKASAIFTEHEHSYSVLSAEITDKINIIQGHIITGGERRNDTDAKLVVLCDEVY